LPCRRAGFLPVYPGEGVRWWMPCPVRSAAMPDESSPVSLGSSALGPNAWLVDEMHDQYLADPSSVSESWRDFFADYKRDAAPQTVAGQAAVQAAAPPPAPAAAPPTAPKAPTPPASAASSAATEPQGDPIRGAGARIVANMEA